MGFSKIKVNPAPLRLAQTIITGLVVALSIAVLGTSAHTLDVFNKQQSSNPWWLPLWSQHFDVHGTKALVASSAVSLALSGLFLAMLVIPYFDLNSKPTLRALVAIGSSGPSSVLALVSVIYAHILNGESPQIDTIQTWTCKYKNGQPLEEDISIPTNMGNGNFKSLCHESKFALYGTLVVMLLLGASMGVSVASWLADKWAARQARKEVEAGSMDEVKL